MEESAWLVPVSIFVVVISLFLLRRQRKQSTKAPPSPPALPLIGHLHLVKEPFPRTLQALSKKLGHIFLLRFGARNVLVVSSPGAVEECLSKNDVNFANRPHTLAGTVLNYNCKSVGFASYGDYWRNLRRVTTLELLSATRLAKLATIREDEVRLMVKQIFEDCKGKEWSAIELRPRLTELAFNMMLRMITGKRYYGNDVDNEGKLFQVVMKEFTELQGAGNLNDFFPILEWIDFQGVKKKMLSVRKRMDSFLDKLIHEHRKNKRNTTLVDIMVDMQEKEPDLFTDESLKSNILVLLVGGSETTATTLEWALSLLLNHPEKMKKAQAEIDTCVGHDQLLKEQDGAKLEYLQNVLTETLRLFPAGPLMIPHESASDCKVGGFDIPKGTMLLVNLWSLHRDEKWWKDPTKFEPERFENVGDSGEELLQYKMLPFGSGRRSCPGAPLAKRVTPHALSALLQSFEWDRIGGEEINMAEGSGITMPKLDPLNVLCRPRQCMIKALSNI